ncbi:MAG: thioredoxin domain-containing protein, partial [Bacteroidia bacterium]|nr:thioredoxin domain-containing protein [Bacteroidia bacterium]
MAENKHQRNNLDNSSSPYLVQHWDNPVWWQEWSSDVISYARQSEKPLFVSVGYSTCHWCHVMASEAFSDERTARYLNDNFVSVKVDREQRPDIDQFLMEFIQKQSGRGGWPLNVFLTPSLNPIFALTYAPAIQRGSMNTFLSIVQQVYSFYQKHKNDISSFEPESDHPEISDDDQILSSLSGFYDSVNGGFGKGHKFPSHSTLLFLLYRFSVDKDQRIKDICYRSLEAMRLRGLNDHLQGGIFRYCVDPEWTIPHFEKMLYDQAMALWVYSLAYRVFGRVEYRSMAENIVRCLEESFSEDGFYISAHDADTDHQEGATYLWSYTELKECLTDDEFSELTKVYDISEEGNFEGRNHLVRKNDIRLNKLENRLLSVRNTRNQPSRDNKILIGINALTAISLLQAGRALDREDLKIRAGALVTGL